ncbi:MAG: carboxypeptidase-like regulatory domain-containing protein [Candidatus Acidiferrales bacterium]
MQRTWAPSLLFLIQRATTVNSAKKDSSKRSLGRNFRRLVFGPGSLVWLSLSLLPCGFPALAQSQQPPIVQSGPPGTPGTGASAGQQLPTQQSSGNISGTVVDRTGAAVAGARVKLTREDQSPSQEVLSGDDGQFSFANIAPGPFQLAITAAGFATQTSSGILHSGEAYIVPQIALAVATVITEVRVTPPPAEVAEEQIKDQEKQRVLGFIPNFYVSYVPNAVPLDSKQKFELAWKTTLDPITFGVTAGAAAIEQADDQFSGYGQGAQGYGKRYGASYADLVTATFIGGAILPSLLKQDPRYFYKGTGSTRSRLLYAIANAVICEGDNRRWQANYSNILGNLAAGGISNLYYPASDRGVELTFENALIGIGETAAANVLQEFVIRKLTPKVPSPDPAKP